MATSCLTGKMEATPTRTAVTIENKLGDTIALCGAAVRLLQQVLYFPHTTA
jgi:hypothetical protein